MERKEQIRKIIFIICLALLLSGLAEVFFLLIENRISVNAFMIEGLTKEFFEILVLKRMVLMTIFFGGIIGIAVSNAVDQILDQVYKKRYYIGAGFLVISVIFELHGSSVLYWQNYFDNSETYSALIGLARSIRSDEWAVNTPMALSQYFNASGAFPYFSETIRGALTDVFIVYGQPVFDLTVIFRPFHWGYLLLDPARGLAFFWTGRLIVLFLISFELGLLLSRKNQKLALIYAFLLTWAPIVQWWFAVNGLVEMLIFGQLAILMTEKYLVSDSYRTRILCAIIFMISGGAYLLTFYPAWQISLGYVFLMLFVSVILEKRKTLQLSYKDALIVVSIVVVLGLAMVYIFSKSYETIEAVMGTVYPGSRFETGGGQLYRFFLYPGNLFLVTSRALPFGNASELSVFFDFFPMGLLLSIWITIREKQKDCYLRLLLILLLILGSYCILSWPGMLAKITLLSNIQPYRVFLAVGFINLILLIRSLALLETEFSFRKKLFLAIVLALLIALSSVKAYIGYINELMMVGTVIVLSVGFYAILGWKKKRNQHILVVIVILITFVSGMFVNPLAKGLDVIYNQDIVQLIKTINDSEKGLWVVDSEEGSGYPLINLPIMVGAATVNSTNVYPNLKRWQLFDPENKYSDIYNRYAHITVHLTELNEIKERFTLDSVDLFTVTLNLEDLKKLGVSYILTKRNLDNFELNGLYLELLGSENGFNIYKVR